MPRRLRYIPTRGTLVEVTCRIIQSRMLLRPCRTLNESIIGALARAKRLYGVRICAAVFLSNHCHLLLEVDDARELARFMAYVNSKIARESSRLTGWREKVWGRRYTAIVVSDEPAAQIARLTYLLSHGVKENLVECCRDWPGVHAAESMVSGRALVGYWFDRTAEYRDRLQGKAYTRYQHATLEPLSFDPLPCWAHLAPADYQARIAEIVSAVEAEAAEIRDRRGIVPLGVDAIKRQNPRQQPVEIKRSSAPAFHAASRRVRSLLVNAYHIFLAAYREAADRLRNGDRGVQFPEGSFPPPIPFAGPLMPQAP